MDIAENAFFLRHQDEIENLCHPLFNNSAIDYFDMHQYYDNGKFLSLTNKPLMVKAYLQEDIYATRNELQGCASNNKLVVIILSKDFYHSATYLDKKAVQNIHLATQLNIPHRIYIVQRRNSYFNLFGFGCSKDEAKVVNAMIDNVDLLLQFGNYFEDKAKLLINRAVRMPCYLLNYIANHCFEDHQLINRKKIIQAICNDKLTNSMQAYCPITKREQECIIRTFQGFTAKEIAKALGLSPRTVEGYLDNVKRKFGSTKKSALWKLMLQLNCTALM